MDDYARKALETIARTTFSGHEMSAEYARGNMDAHATCAEMAKTALALMDSTKFNWETLKCRFGCDSPVAGLYHAPEGCICFPDMIQALCQQHAVKGMQNNDMSLLVSRPY